MITKEFLKTKLECSDMYAQKLIDEAQETKTSYMTYLSKTCRTSHTPRYRRILRSVKMPKENITYTEKMAQKILRSSSIKIT